MSTRHFHLRLKARYEGEKNDINDLQVEVLKKGQWDKLDLSVRSPGFLLYINALFSCQHLYMRTNAAERKLILESSEAEMQLNASQQWLIQDVKVSFKAKLKSGTPGEDDLAYIRERMHHCPVSSNLPESVDLQNAVEFF